MKRLTILMLLAALLLAGVFATAEGAVASGNAGSVSCSTSPNAHPCKTPKRWTADFKKLLKQSPKLKLSAAQDAAFRAAKHYVPSQCPDGIGRGCPLPPPTAYPFGSPGQDGSGVSYHSFLRLAVYPCHKQKTTLTWKDLKYEGVRLRTKEFVCSMTFLSYEREDVYYQGSTYTTESCGIGSAQLRVIKAPVFVDTLGAFGGPFSIGGGPDDGGFEPFLRPLPGLHGKKWPKIEVGLLHDLVGQVASDPNPPAGVGKIPCP